MIGGDMPFKAELVEQRLLDHRPLAHHRNVLLCLRGLKQDFTPPATPTFSTISANCGHCAAASFALEADVTLTVRYPARLGLSIVNDGMAKRSRFDLLSRISRWWQTDMAREGDGERALRTVAYTLSNFGEAL